MSAYSTYAGILFTECGCKKYPPFAYTRRLSSTCSCVCTCFHIRGRMLGQSCCRCLSNMLSNLDEWDVGMTLYPSGCFLVHRLAVTPSAEEDGEYVLDWYVHVACLLDLVRFMKRRPARRKATLATAGRRIRRPSGLSVEIASHLSIDRHGGRNRTEHCFDSTLRRHLRLSRVGSVWLMHVAAARRVDVLHAKVN